MHGCWGVEDEPVSAIDFKKTLDAYAARPDVFRVVDVPTMQYLMVDGHGDPNTSEQFTRAVESLFPVAYKLKFASKLDGRDYVVMPLEGLWWSPDNAVFTTARDKSQWNWTLMVMAPDWITREMFDAALAKAGKTGVRLETLAEGRVVQTLHLGSFDDEAATLETMHTEFIPDNGLVMTGRHHEIYFSDFRRTPPEKLRTILRQPVTTSDNQ